MYRGLAKDRPDAFLPDLAGSLNNLGNRLSDLGRREDALAAAQEAVDIRRKLAKDRPDAFLPDLALSLGALGSILRESALLSDAGAAFEDGIKTLQSPFLKLPSAHAKLMASLVNDYMDVMKKLGNEPDMDLLMPIFEKFQELKGND